MQFTSFDESISQGVTKSNNKSTKKWENIAKRIDNIIIWCYIVVTTKRNTRYGGDEMRKVKKYEELSELKGRMRKEGYSYRKLSEETGISVNAINNKLNGYSAMDTDDVELITKTLGILPEEIMLYFFPQMLRNASK